MLVVVIPDADAILAQQEREQALYFSAAAEGVLRREGLISVSTLDLSEISSAPANPSYLYTRGVSPHRTVLDLAKQRPLAFEGPLSASVLDWLGLRASVRQVERLTLRLPDKSESWTIARPTVEIGVPARELKLPRAWTSKAIAIQKLDGIVAESVALEVLLPDGTAAPAVFRHKGVWISALPLFDLIGEHFAFPPLTDRYNTRKRSNRMNELAAMLLKDIANFLEKSADAYTVTCERWPSGFKSAFTIRHDYDRDISPTEHASLMQLYQRLNLKCSMGYLGYLLPEDQIQDLVRQGHEVQLHAYESTSEELARDVQQLGKIADCPVRGVTIHGGTTSIGFRGDMHFAWLERAGVSYVESFSIDAYPSPIYRPDPLGIIRRSSLVASPMHFSMDVSTEVGAHRLDFMLEKVNFNLENGMAAIAMNHPDLNRKELTQLLETLPREFLWCTTLGEICHWERASKYDPTVAAQNGNLLIRFKEPLPQTAVFHVKWGRAADQPLTIPAGSQSAYLRQSGELRVSADAPVQHVAVPRISSRLRPPRGKLKSGLRRARRVVGRVKRLALEAIARTQPRPSATLISRISNRIGIDALAAAVRPEARIVLQRANLQEGEIDFLDLISNPSRWPRLQAVIGLSVANDLHPIMVEAMASIVEAQTPSHARPLDGRNAARAPLPTGNPRARRLAKWIVDRAGKAREGDTNFPREELAYYLASNALRARGVANIIDALGPATVRVLVDHGSGIGLMPWLLAGGTKRIEHAILVEPVARYAPPLQELWQEADSDGFTRWERVETVSENFEYAGPADVILFCQALVRVAPERRGTVLNQAWNALRPGGLLLINEVLTDGETQSGSAQALVNRAELVDIMSWRGAPDLFRMEGDWRVPEDPLLWTVKEIGSTGIIVAKKGELEIATVSAGDKVEEKAENDTPQLPPLATANVGEVAGQVPEQVIQSDILILSSLPAGPACGWRCAKHVLDWGNWFATKLGGTRPPVELDIRERAAAISDGPLAMLLIPQTEEGYQKEIGAKSRNMLRKAARAGYSVRRFLTADYLSDLHAINTSMPERGGIRMTEGYQTYPKSSDPSPGDFCAMHNIVSIGCFLGDKLVAYCFLAVVGEMAIVNRILGHGEHLPNGIMNLLVEGIVTVLRQDFPRVRAINYLTLRSARDGIDQFKRSVGFRDIAVVFKAPGLGDDNLDVGPVARISPFGYRNLSPFDESYFIGKGLNGYAPNVPDHRESGLRAILNHLALARDARVLDASDHGATASGAATPDLLVEKFDGPIDILDPRAEAAKFLSERYGSRANVRHAQFLRYHEDGLFDLVIVDLSAAAMVRYFEEFIDRARLQLKQGGHLVSFLLYDTELAFGGSNPILNPADRSFNERCLRFWFGQTKVAPAAARPVLWQKGFAVHSIVDKWMSNRGAGWIDMEKL